MLSMLITKFNQHVNNNESLICLSVRATAFAVQLNRLSLQPMSSIAR